jgi:Arc/MetJ-type ribon-helix-helix transcriptional regulator
MQAWEQARLPQELYNQVTATIEKKRVWINELEFIREAVREKLARVALEA